MTTVLETQKQVEQKVLLHGVSWGTYEQLLYDFVDSHAAHFTYDDGTLEIMVLSFEHEKLKHNLSLLVEFLASELGVDVEGAGSTTFRRKDLAKGFEPDASFYFRDAALIRQKDAIDLNTDPPPELVIEIDITSPSLNKFPIFAALGVAEVWRCDGERVHFFRLGEAGYAGVAESASLPGVSEETVNRLLEASRKMKRADWLRLVRESAGGQE